IAPASPCLPSLLLATRTTGLLARRAKSANARSFGVRPARASITNIRASASPIAPSVCSCIRAVSEPLAASSRPAVSMMVNSRSPRRASPSLRSRVTPGSSSTSASFCPTSRLNSVDFPTLGRPIMAIVKDMNDPCAFYGAHVNETETPRLARKRTARHGRRERRLRLLRLAGRRVGLIGRRRGGALARDLLRLGRWRRRGRGVFFGRGLRIRRGSLGRGRCGAHAWLALFGLRGLLRWQRLRRRRRGGGRGRLGVLLVRLLLRALVQILRHALFET